MLIAAALLLSQAKLAIGSPMPAFAPERFVQGTPFKLSKDKTYVVEFWATWCGPCIQAMPHMSALAEKYRGKVTFVGVNVSDRREANENKLNSPEHVKRISNWVKKNKDRIRYNVALDDAMNTVYGNWLAAAGQSGIPCAFVVTQGKVAWFGHPLGGLESVLAEVTSGKFSIARAKDRAARQAKAQALIPSVLSAASTGNLGKTEQVYKQLIALDPNLGVQGAPAVTLKLAEKNGDAAVSFLKNRVSDVLKNAPAEVVDAAFVVFPKVQGKAGRTALRSLVAQQISRVPNALAAGAYGQYALILKGLGATSEARTWIKRAEGKIPYADKSVQKAVKEFVSSAKKNVG